MKSSFSLSFNKLLLAALPLFTHTKHLTGGIVHKVTKLDMNPKEKNNTISILNYFFKLLERLFSENFGLLPFIVYY